MKQVLEDRCRHSVGIDHVQAILLAMRHRWIATLTRGGGIVLLSTVFLWASETLACSASIDPAAADRRDRARQRELAGELANQADTIFVATAAVVYPSPTSVN